MRYSIKNRAVLTVQNDPLLRKTVKLWIAARFVEGGWRVMNPSSVNLTANSNGADIPLLLSGQIGSIFLARILEPLRRQVLAELDKLASTSRKDHWLTIMLSIFILLYNDELVMKHQRNFAKSRKAPVSSSEVVTLHQYPNNPHHFQVHFTNMPLINALHAGAKTLLVAFHFCCKGRQPFHMDWSAKEPWSPRAFCNWLEDDTAARMARIAQIICFRG